ncbi:MAG: hypothetical protein VX085_19745 [Pseudomonadota bacterium]|nr:hypothetical protein [Pseudomonadota bacterium]
MTGGGGFDRTTGGGGRVRRTGGGAETVAVRGAGAVTACLWVDGAETSRGGRILPTRFC